MFKFLFKKEQRVEALIYDYLDTLKLIQDNFSKALTLCLVEPQCENFFLIISTNMLDK